MMDKRYSQMTQEELREEISQLKLKAQKAVQMDMVNEFAVHERKMTMAQAYLLDPAAFKAGDTYAIRDSSEEQFKISYMNGVFAWGNRNGNPIEEALPISLLGKKLNH